MKKNTICFVYRSVQYVLLGDTNKIIGGAEVQQKIIAEELIQNGWEVIFLTEQFGDGKIKTLPSNIKICPFLDFKTGHKITRKLLRLPITIWKSLKAINADIYYQRNPDFMSGIIASFCKMYGKQFVIAGASNWNFDKGNEGNLNNPLDRLLARHAIRITDKIIVQNHRQKLLLKNNYGKNGHIFYNVYPKKKLRTSLKHILWVGRIASLKRPMMFLELARKLPKHKFVMVGGNSSNPSLKAQIEEEARKIKNIKYLGHQPYEKVEELFDEASLFICTYRAGIEGFPNTFLQAWSRGIPIVSSMELDGLITENELGIVTDTISEMAEGIEELIKKTNLAEYSKKIQAFFSGKFLVSTQICNFMDILNR
jgi:glycosyltransferase involved in cell wall biosynthesis